MFSFNYFLNCTVISYNKNFLIIWKLNYIPAKCPWYAENNSQASTDHNKIYPVIKRRLKKESSKSFPFLKIFLGSHDCKWSCWRTGQVMWKHYSTLLVPRGEAESEMASYSSVNWSVSVLPLSVANTTDVVRIVTGTGNKIKWKRTCT